jgi:hypothetical protein
VYQGVSIPEGWNKQGSTGPNAAKVSSCFQQAPGQTEPERIIFKWPLQGQDFGDVPLAIEACNPLLPFVAGAGK